MLFAPSAPTTYGAVTVQRSSVLGLKFEGDFVLILRAGDRPSTRAGFSTGSKTPATLSIEDALPSWAGRRSC